MRKFLILAALALIGASCSGCALFCDAAQPKSFDGLSEGHAEAIPSIAGHAAAHVASIYSPGRTSLHVDTGTRFGASLSSALRELGFSMMETGLQIDYSLDVFESDNSYSLTLYLPDGVLSQGYTLDTTGKGEAAVPTYKNELYQLTKNTAHHGQTPTSPVRATASTITPAASPPEKAPDAVNAKQVAAKPADGFVDENVIEPEATNQDIKPLWTLEPGMLRPQMENWAKFAGYQLIWRATHDYDMEAPVSFNDDFLPTLHALFTQMHQQGNPLRVTVYRANRVIEVTEE